MRKNETVLYVLVAFLLTIISGVASAPICFVEKSNGTCASTGDSRPVSTPCGTVPGQVLNPSIGDTVRQATAGEYGRDGIENGGDCTVFALYDYCGTGMMGFVGSYGQRPAGETCTGY